MIGVTSPLTDGQCGSSQPRRGEPSLSGGITKTRVLALFKNSNIFGYVNDATDTLEISIILER
ncbi:hypothetical protein T09_829 [Trichinella sp. T9]|nr:hypothetical protein T09_829 [Trichinella sp. T9]